MTVPSPGDWQEGNRDPVINGKWPDKDKPKIINYASSWGQRAWGLWMCLVLWFGSLWQLLAHTGPGGSVPSAPERTVAGQDYCTVPLLNSKTAVARNTVPQVTSPGSWPWEVTQAGGRTQLRSSEHPCLYQ